MFARHGLPDCLVSDSGPQFAKEYGFHHITSSPHYAPANGLAERTVRTIKSVLEKSFEPYLGLLSYRTAPLEHFSLFISNSTTYNLIYTTKRTTMLQESYKVITEI